MKSSFCIPENIAKNLIFIDGITRCGKSLFSSIISSFSDMEHIQFSISSQLEAVIASIMLECIDKNFAKAYLRMLFNELSYNIQLSRNINFRASDQTGIDNYKQPDIYHQRLTLEEGDSIVDYLRKADIGIPIQTHDMMVNIDILEEMDLSYKVIELYRNPIDNLYSWWTRGWGERHGVDPRSLASSVSYKGNSLPWHCVGYEDKVVDLNPYEKCCVIGMDLINRSVQQQKKARFPEKILTITFEEMVQRPDVQLNRIEKFIGRKMTKYTPKFVEEARCPRVLDPKDTEKKLSILKNNVDTVIFDQLINLTESYERDVYGLLHSY